MANYPNALIMLLSVNVYLKQRIFLAIPTTCFSLMIFLFHSACILIYIHIYLLSKWVRRLFTSSRSTYPSESSVINMGPAASIDPFRYLGIIMDKIFKCSPHIFSCAKKPRGQTFRVKGLRHFLVKQGTIFLFVYQCVFPFLLYCFHVIFPI